MRPAGCASPGAFAFSVLIDDLSASTVWVSISCGDDDKPKPGSASDTNIPAPVTPFCSASHSCSVTWVLAAIAPPRLEWPESPSSVAEEFEMLVVMTVDGAACGRE